MDHPFVIGLIVFQTLFTITGYAWIYFKFLRKSEDDIKIVFLEEVNSIDGFLKKSYTVKIKQQIYYRNIPLGEPSVVVENTIEEANKEQIERILKEYIDPFIALGTHFVQIKSGNFFTKFKK